MKSTILELMNTYVMNDQLTWNREIPFKGFAIADRISTAQK